MTNWTKTNNWNKNLYYFYANNAMKPMYIVHKIQQNPGTHETKEQKSKTQLSFGHTYTERESEREREMLTNSTSPVLLAINTTKMHPFFHSLPLFCVQTWNSHQTVGPALHIGLYYHCKVQLLEFSVMEIIGAIIDLWCRDPPRDFKHVYFNMDHSISFRQVTLVSVDL